MLGEFLVSSHDLALLLDHVVVWKDKNPERVRIG